VTLPEIRSTPSRLHYAWVIVAVTFAVAVVTAGVRSTPGVLIVPLEQEFHWSRATISFALGINLLLFGAIGPFAAALMDRFGARRTITLALATAAVSVMLTPAMSQPWQLILLWGVGVGLLLPIDCPERHCKRLSRRRSIGRRCRAYDAPYLSRNLWWLCWWIVRAPPLRKMASRASRRQP
jgi:cyanate permease